MIDGKLQKCGCYDGPYCDSLPKTLVSVRCLLHRSVPAQHGYSLMHRDEQGQPHTVASRYGSAKKGMISSSNRREL